MLSLVSRNGILSLGLHLQISESSSEAFLVCSIVNFNECEMRLISAKNLCKLSFEPKNMNRQSSRNLLYKRRGLTPFSPNFIAAILIFSSIKLIKISATFGAHFVPIAVPMICWYSWSSNTNMLYLRTKSKSSKINSDGIVLSFLVSRIFVIFNFQHSNLFPPPHRPPTL